MQIYICVYTCKLDTHWYIHFCIFCSCMNVCHWCVCRYIQVSTCRCACVHLWKYTWHTVLSYVCIYTVVPCSCKYLYIPRGSVGVCVYSCASMCVYLWVFMFVCAHACVWCVCVFACMRLKSVCTWVRVLEVCVFVCVCAGVCFCAIIFAYQFFIL